MVTPNDIRPHITVVRVEDGDLGARWWSEPLHTSQEVRDFTAKVEAQGDWVDQVCCSSQCWCSE